MWAVYLGLGAESCHGLNRSGSKPSLPEPGAVDAKALVIISEGPLNSNHHQVEFFPHQARVSDTSHRRSRTPRLPPKLQLATATHGPRPLHPMPKKNRPPKRPKKRDSKSHTTENHGCKRYLWKKKEKRYHDLTPLRGPIWVGRGPVTSVPHYTQLGVWKRNFPFRDPRTKRLAPKRIR
jgi:hypothetical protein